MCNMCLVTIQTEKLENIHRSAGTFVSGDSTGNYMWCLCGQALVCNITDHYHPCLNLGVGISEGCFIFDFASLPLEVTRPI